MSLIITAHSRIRPYHVKVNGTTIYHDENFITFAEFIKPFFKQLNLGYPKFYKMDPLSKLGFTAAELVLQQIDLDLYDRKRIGIVLANASSSLDTDIAHQQTIDDRTQYFPSPSVFVYTLPNIMIGEICIRHQLRGENGFLIAENFDGELLVSYVNELFLHHRVDACLTGWVDLLKDHFDAFLMFVEQGKDASKKGPGSAAVPFTEEEADRLYKIT